jgi:hypothetical protein
VTADRHTRLQGSLARLKAADKLDPTPRTAHELVTREKLAELERDVAELRGRLDTLVWLVVGAVVLQVVMQLGGWG